MIDKAIKDALDSRSAPTVAAADSASDQSTSTSTPSLVPSEPELPIVVETTTLSSSSSSVAMEVDHPVPVSELVSQEPAHDPAAQHKQQQPQLYQEQQLQEEMTLTPFVEAMSMTTAPVTSFTAPITPGDAASATPVPITPAEDVPAIADQVDAAVELLFPAAADFVVPTHYHVSAPVQLPTPSS